MNDGFEALLGVGADWHLGSTQDNHARGTIVEFGWWWLQLTGAANGNYKVASVASLVDTDEATFGQRGRAHIVESHGAGKIEDLIEAKTISILLEWSLF